MPSPFNMMSNAACHCGQQARWVLHKIHPITGLQPTDTVCEHHKFIMQHDAGKNLHAMRIEDTKFNTERLGNYN